MPTYAALRLYVDSWRWEGVPFYVRAGKSLSVTTTEVFIEFKLPPQVVFAEAVPSMGNYVRFRLNPAGRDRDRRAGEAPGRRHGGTARGALGRGAAGSRAALGDYERLLGDAMAGDATLFARQDVVEAAWAIVDPLIQSPGPVFEYEPGTWGPPQADRLVGDVGGWNTPQ